ncbi:RodZ domain-containing protein [Methylophilus sp. OH31]|uniref:helix-turn-helix domain-containing protein n=1 Tax=Methylophilus sp. OH31 TaxID=1387312 RepID=UPI0004656223|nr:RodZ domain-containing protein [Methylophilus sp. OH31]
MHVTSEDKTNVNPVPAEATDKPKRGRKRKAETDQVSGQAYQVAMESQQGQASDEFIQTTTSAEHTPASDAPEEYGAAMALESAPQPASATLAYGSGCGNVLKAAREAQGLSIHEVCSQLRLGIKQIQAIEQDDFEKLPQPSIVRGFIRNYARLLNIDVNPILEAYQRIVPNKAPLPLSVRSNASRSVIDKPVPVFRPQRLLTFLIFLILAGIAAYFYINHIKPQALKDAALALDVDEIGETTGQEIAIPAPEAAPAPATTTVAPVTENVDASTTTTVDNAVPAATVTGNDATSNAANTLSANNAIANNTIVSTPTPATTQAAESTTLQASEPQKASLVFKVNEDSWVRIEDMQGKKVFSEVMPAGSERQVTTEKPVNITVGHASGTQLTIDNQPYDLTQATRGRVARIQLK